MTKLQIDFFKVQREQSEIRSRLSEIRATAEADITPEKLSIKATLPETREADDVLKLVKAQILRGLSVGFIALRERIEGGIRVIERAALRNIAVVDSGAYPATTIAAREKPPTEAERERWREYIL